MSQWELSRKILGHGNCSTTEIYLHSLGESERVELGDATFIEVGEDVFLFGYRIEGLQEQSIH